MSTISASTTSTTAFNVTADTTGTLVLQTGATPTTALTLGSDQNVTFAGYANLPNTFGFKNRIINGAMMIDQRNAGASVTVNASSNIFATDRWFGYGQATDGVFTLQQSSTAPAGFTNSLALTVTTADASIGSTQIYVIAQNIEGLNLPDLGWGTADAQAVTLSFKVRSSLTGTFGGALRNSDGNRSYPFTYTISSANTWETKTVTVSGDASGTWVTTNGIGMRITFGVGLGSTYLGAAGSWAGTNYISATGATNIIATSGATFYITGVQLEKGSTATSFDFRSIGTELALCQRYYEKSYDVGTAVATNTQNGTCSHSGATQGSGIVFSTIFFAVNKRAAPTVTMYSETGTSGQWYYERSGASGYTTSVSESISERQSRVRTSGIGANFAAASVYGHWVASSEL